MSAGDSKAIVEMAAEFARREIAPLVADYDRDERIPRELLDRMGGLGFFGGVIPEELGGSGLDYLTFVELIEEVSKTCQILGSYVAGMTTTYRRDGDDFVINGAKAWISNLDVASFFVTFASVDRSLGRSG